VRLELFLASNSRNELLIPLAVYSDINAALEQSKLINAVQLFKSNVVRIELLQFNFSKSIQPVTVNEVSCGLLKQ
jgi:hypothetical protein